MGNLQFKRGLKADLPTSETEGTPLWCTDTNELYIGTGDGVEKVSSSNSSTTDDTYSKAEIDEMIGDIETLLQEI